jgi:methyl-accepting chemotaxis protein
MKWFNNLKIAKKLAVTFAALVVLITFIGLWDLKHISDSNTALVDVYENSFLPSVLVADLKSEVISGRAGMIAMMNEAVRTTQEKIYNEVKNSSKKVDDDITELLSSKRLTPDDKKSLEGLKQVWGEFKDVRDTKVVPSIYEGDTDNVRTWVFGIQAERHKRIISITNELVERKMKAAEDLKNTRAREYTAKIRPMAIAVQVIGAILAVILAYVIHRGIAVPVNNAVDMLKDIATGEGDLTKRLDVRQMDEVGELSRWFNTFVEKIHDMVVQINEMALNVASASQQMSATSEQMSRAIISENEQVTRVASSMEEMSATVLEVAKNATNASNSARHAVEMAESGGRIVQEGINSTNNIAHRVRESAKTVEELGASSQKIGEIVSVIDDIADQTNLLALNAAIEAARAGEHGRGFAVVADEVRKLAEKTTKATKEIAGMVKTIQKITQEAVQSMGAGSKEVEAGVELSKKVGDSFQDIIKSVKTVTDMINQIATAAEEQASASEEVSGNITTISDSTKQSSTGAQQNAEVARNLSGQASELQKMLTQFKLKEALSIGG